PRARRTSGCGRTRPCPCCRPPRPTASWKAAPSTSASSSPCEGRTPQTCLHAMSALALEVPMIVITTPVGQIGRQVLGNLLDSGEQLRVIARDPSQLPAEVREDLDIVEGSHGDAAVVDKAFAGADAVFWLTPPDPRAPSVDAAFAGFTRPAAEAFHRHGVGRVVGVSMLGRGTPWAAQAGFATGSLAMDDLIAASGVAYRALANPYFMEDTARQAQAIKNQGLFLYPIAGDRKRPTVATRDIAAAASRLLLDASWSDTGEAPLLGPEESAYKSN